MNRYTNHGEYLRPVVSPTPREDTLGYYGDQWVWAPCYGNDQEAKDLKRTTEPTSQCRVCLFQFPSALLRDGTNYNGESMKVPPLHERTLNIYDQAQAQVKAIGGLLGLDGEQIMIAELAASNRDNHVDSVDLMVAIGLNYLATTLIKRATVVEASRKIAGLATFKRERDEYPFFSEATLYDLIGKDDARSLLARVRAVIRATGASLPEGEEA